MVCRVICLMLIGSLISGCESSKKAEPETKAIEKNGEVKMVFTITSTAFEHEGMIPVKYTCDGADISPPFSWKNAPAGTKSFALICDDPDAPMGTWVHWVLFNLPENTNQLQENIPTDEKLGNGALQGINSWPRIGYGGPCPPSGTHRYFFKFYALDTMLEVSGEVSKDRLLQAMQGHILAQTEIMGKYER